MALCAASKEQGEVERHAINRVLGCKVDKLAFLDSTEVVTCRWEGRKGAVVPPSLGADLSANLLLAHHSGVPMESGIASCYWRKKTPAPMDPDPDRDGCGLIWCSPTVPFDGDAVMSAVEIIEEQLWRHGFEPFISLQCMTERAVDVIAAIVYDRDVEGEDERALACHDEVLRQLVTQGYIPYRLGILSMKWLSSIDDDYGKFIRTLKAALDPNNILAPGRYDSSVEPG